MPDFALRAVKKTLRTQMQALRADIAPAYPNASQSLCTNFLAAIDIAPHMVVSGYMALRDEIDPVFLMATLADKGCTLALPIVQGPGTNLIFRAYAPGTPLVTGAMGIPEPSAKSPTVIPDVLIVPLLAFDRKGHRLGYGAGYYDRTLLTLRAHKNITAIGVGYGEQEVSSVPHGLHDAPLDKIVTNLGVISP